MARNGWGYQPYYYNLCQASHQNLLCYVISGDARRLQLNGSFLYFCIYYCLWFYLFDIYLLHEISIIKCSNITICNMHIQCLEILRYVCTKNLRQFG
jgi:hypothetical protein